MTLKKSRHSSGINLEPTSEVLSDNGDIQVSIDTKELQVKLDNSDHVVVTNDQTQTLTNKTIDADVNTISNLEVDNLKSGVLNTNTSLSGASDTQIPSALAVKTYVDNGLAAQNEASEISYDNTTSGLAATNVQAAIDEVEGRLQTAETDISNHISDTVDAHDASAISSIPAGNLAATDVQSALNELQSDVDTRATSAALSAHTGASSGVHGVVGSVVGTSDIQALTNKTIDADQNTISNIDNADIKAGANIARSKLASGTAYRLLANNASGVMSENAVLTSTRIPYADANGQLTDSSDLTVTANGVVLGTTKHLELQASTDSSTTGSNASLASFTAGGVRLTNASLTSLANIPAGANGQQVILFNRTGAAITLVDSSNAVGTAANRIYTGTNASISFANNAAFILSYDSTSSRWQVVGGSGSGTGSSELPIEVLMQQTFETASLTDFIQTGLSLPTASNILIKGTKLALLTHQPATSQSFKQTIAVDNKFKGYLSQLSLDIRSTATSGNVTILFRDETNNADIGTSQQITTGSQAISVTTTSGLATLDALTPSQIATLAVGQSVTGSGIPAGTTIASINTSTFVVTLSANATASATVTARFSALPITRNFSFAIPTNCSSISYTVTALQEASSPETYVDDIIIKLAQSANTTTSITVPKNNNFKDRTYSPVVTNNTNISGTLYYSRNENMMTIRGNLTWTGAGTTGYLSFPIPEGLTTPVNHGTIFGRMAITDTGIQNYTGVVRWNSISNAIAIHQENVSGTNILPFGGFSFTPNAGDFVEVFAEIPISSWGVAETESKTIPLTSSVIQTQPDSCLIMQGGTLSGTQTALDFSIVAQSVGTAIRYDSATRRFYVNEPGLYNASVTDESASATVNTLALIANVNGSDLNFSVDDIVASQQRSSASGSIYLNTNDYFRVGASNSRGSGGTRAITISKNGSSKIINPSSDQKIEIPTHELRFENASSRGSTDTAIVKFDTLTKIKGDGFTVTNTVANGTVIVIKKAGLLSVNTTLYYASAAILTITKNLTSLTTGVPTVSNEILAGDGIQGTSEYGGASWTGPVNVGDVIRIASNVTPLTQAANSLSLSLQEQSVSVALQNVSPRWNDSDTSLMLSGANGFGTTATTVRRFSSVTNNLGTAISYVDTPASGAVFTVNESGLYSIKYQEDQSSTSPTSYGISIGNSVTPTSITYQTFNQISIIGISSGVIYLTKGQTFVVGSVNPGNVATSSIYTRLYVSKVGKTQGTVDVTPFVNIQTQDTEAIEALTPTGTWGSTNTGVPVLNITKNTNKGILQVLSNSVDGTSFKALKNCELKIVVSGEVASVANNLYITNNSTVLTAAAPSGVLSRTSIEGNTFKSTAADVVLNAGDVVRIQRSAVTTFNIIAVTLTASALSDSVATQTQQMSSDTMSFVFKSTAIVDSDPIGTFNTYYFPTAGSNTTARSSTTPNQSLSDMNANGLRIFPRAFNVANTASQGSPSVFEIKVGSNYKLINTFLHSGTGKTWSWDRNPWSQGTIDYGTYVRYNPSLGILQINCGLGSASGTTRYVDARGDIAADGYLSFTSSSTPNLATIPYLNPRVAIITEQYAAGTATGTPVATTWTNRSLNTIKSDPTGMIASLTSNLITFTFTGTVSIISNSCLYNSSENRSRLRNTTDGITVAVSNNTRQANGGASSGPSQILDQVDVVAGKTYSLQYWATIAASGGLGSAMSTGEIDIHAQIMFQRIK